MPGFTCHSVWEWSSASPFGETRCFPVERCVQFISRSRQIFNRHTRSGGTGQAGCTSRSKVDSRVRARQNLDRRGAGGKSGCTSQEAAPPRWRPRSRDTGLASKEGANGLRTKWLMGAETPQVAEPTEKAVLRSLTHCEAERSCVGGFGVGPVDEGPDRGDLFFNPQGCEVLKSA